MNTTSLECTLIQERLPALLDDDLPAGEAALVNAHLASCAACAAEREATVRFLARLRGANADAEAFTTARARLATAIDTASTPGAMRRLTRVPLALRVAAVLALCAGALAWMRPPVFALDAVARTTGSVLESVPWSDLRLDAISGDAASRGERR